MRHGGLIDARRMETNVSVGSGEDEVAGIVRGNDARGSAVKAERDLARVGGWRDAEVVFELSLITVVNEVDAGINRLILDTAQIEECRGATWRDRCQ